MATRSVRTGAIALSVVAICVSGLLLVASWSLATEYGSSAIDPWPGAAFWALGPALLLALALWWDLRLLGRRVAPWILGVGCFAALLAATALTVALAGRYHDEAIVASACSAEDIQILAVLPLETSARTGPRGDVRGGCSVVVSLTGEPAAVMATVSRAMRADGWLQWGSGTTLTFSRGSANVVVSGEPGEATATQVRVTVLDEGNDAFPPDPGQGR